MKKVVSLILLVLVGVQFVVADYAEAKSWGQGRALRRAQGNRSDRQFARAGKKLCKENGGSGLECRAQKNQAKSQGRGVAFYQEQKAKQNARNDCSTSGGTYLSDGTCKARVTTPIIH